MTFLDTGFLIDLMRADAQATIKLQHLLDGYQPIGVSAITVMELHHGIPRSNQPGKEMQRIDRGLRGITTYAVTHDIAAKAGQIDGTLMDQGQTIGVADSIIAATALEHGEPVITRNTKHFSRVTGLEIDTY